MISGLPTADLGRDVGGGKREGMRQGLPEMSEGEAGRSAAADLASLHRDEILNLFRAF